jgi:hypothetical protein
MIDAAERTPTRILKSRDLAATPPRAATLPVPGPAPLAPLASSPSAPASAHAGPKEVRLIPVDGGSSALEVRCSCGEITRVELKFGGQPRQEGAR